MSTHNIIMFSWRNKIINIFGWKEKNFIWSYGLVMYYVIKSKIMQISKAMCVLKYIQKCEFMQFKGWLNICLNASLHKLKHYEINLCIVTSLA